MKLWIARDKNGTLCVFSYKPELYPEYGNIWGLEDAFYKCIELDSRLFREITFENSPQQVELKLIEG